MKNCIGIVQALVLSLTFTTDAASLRRGQKSYHDESDLPQIRQLQDDGIKNFQTLSCNTFLASSTCKSWSSTFGTNSSISTRVTIPCGECVVMDHANGNLALLGGLDIIGKLIFPDGYRLNLTSTMIVVQGELEMIASKPVDGIPNVKFTMIGSDGSLTFTPVDVNTKACKGVTTCSVGKKGIVVAGGKVNCKYR
jgi:G8 domain